MKQRTYTVYEIEENDRLMVTPNEDGTVSLHGTGLPFRLWIHPTLEHCQQIWELQKAMNDIVGAKYKL